MFGLSPWELLVVGVVAVLLFGSRLPSVARSMGKSMTEFKRGMQDLQHDFRDAMREADTPTPTPAAGAQARLPGASVAHDDSLPDRAYDTLDPACEEPSAATPDADNPATDSATDPDAHRREAATHAP